MRYFLRFDTDTLPEDTAEVVVIGSGIGGLTSAITLKEIGIDPVVLTRGIGNTYYSQGGIASAVHPEDSTYSHYLDTLKAGRFLNDPDSLRILVDQGVERIADLERWGVRFDRKGNFYDTTTEGGHSFPRVLKVKDYTGREIYNRLLDRARSLGIRFVSGELQEILGEERVEGVLYTDGTSLRVMRTKAVVLATGGAASIFRHTSNPSAVRGDSIGSALRAGARVRNPEFVQFHPTVLKGTGLLISEAVRGEGAHLIDCRGQRFVDELLPRDVVARAIYQKLKDGCDVFLDLRPVAGRGVDLGRRFPTIVSFLKEKGIDPLSEPVPVIPAAHYYIGGIDVDLWGKTTVKGLYAVGECSCTGVHGANRLASNSLLEGVVFGRRVAYRVFHDLGSLKLSRRRIRNDVRGKTLKVGVDFQKLRELMWDSAGLERDEITLKKALAMLEDWIEELSHGERDAGSRQLYDLLLVSRCTVEGALIRKESRGVHFRRDFPGENPAFCRDTFITFEENR